MTTVIERLEAEYVLQQHNPYLDTQGQASTAVTTPSPPAVRGYELARRIECGRKILQRQAQAVQNMIELLEGTPQAKPMGKKTR